MTRPSRRYALGITTLASLAACALDAPSPRSSVPPVGVAATSPALSKPSDGDDATTERRRAEEISTAYAARDGAAHRLAVTTAIHDLQRMSEPRLVIALSAYTDVVEAEGADGLESVLVTGIAMLASRSPHGRLASVAALDDLDRVYWSREDGPGHILVSVARAGDPTVHHVSIALVRIGLESQIENRDPDFENALATDLCTEEGLAAIAAELGPAHADGLRELCGGPASIGPSAGGMGLGLMSVASTFDCLFDREPTRAERVEAQMEDCSESLLDGGGGDPLADGSVFSRVRSRDEATGSYLYRWTNSDGETKGFRELFYDESGTAVYQWFYDMPYEDAMPPPPDYDVDATQYYDELGQPAYTENYTRDDAGNITRIDTADAAGNHMHSTELTQDPMTGERTWTTRDEDGRITWTVTFGEDAMGNPIVDATPYDEDGNPIPDNDAQLPGSDGWGSTEECAELYLTLIEDRIRDVLQSHGSPVPPTVVFPTGDAEVEAGDLDCLTLDTGILAESSYECHDETKHCAFGMIQLGDECMCGSLGDFETVMPASQCALFLMCADGVAPVEIDGVCSCVGNDDIFTDEGFGGLGGGGGGDPWGD
jgi:hypothetical protein